MPQWHPRECKVCGARRPFVSISATGLCPDHSRMRQIDNVRQLKEKRGPAFERWLQATAKGLVRQARQLAEAPDEA